MPLNPLAWLLTIARAPRLHDASLRLLLVGGLGALGAGVVQAWPHLARAVVLPNLFAPLLHLLVAGAFLLLFIGMVTSLVFGPRATARSCRWLNDTAGKFVVWLLKNTVMFAVNIAVLLLKLAAALVGTGGALPKATDALAHFVERTADAAVRPMR